MFHASLGLMLAGVVYSCPPLESFISGFGPPRAGVVSGGWGHEIHHGMHFAVPSYRRVARYGGWPIIDRGETLYVGDRSSRVVVAREHLVITEDLPRHALLVPQPDLFDLQVAEALRRYQYRHGIRLTGALDEETVRAMSVPVQERLRVMLLNIERMRWLASFDLDRSHVLVNVAAFEVWLFEEGRRVESIRAVVGTLRRQTPTFSNEIEYLEVNPVWKVPTTIVRARILPRATRDPGWLTRAGFELRGKDGRVDPLDIDWSKVEESRHLPYRVVQRPGPYNAMGRVKFIFPNERGIYLHDTPDKDLFERSSRMASFGCVRVERPAALARFLMKGMPEDEMLAVKKMIAGGGRGKTRRVELETPIPVHLTYITAWVDEKGLLHFRDDVYARDAKRLEWLDAECPGWDGL